MQGGGCKEVESCMCWGTAFIDLEVGIDLDFSEGVDLMTR